MDTATAWASGKPVYNRLPGANEGYHKDENPDVVRDVDDNDPPVALWLTDYWDAFLVGLKGKLDEVRDRQMDPMLCDPEWLDVLAAMAGYTGGYWDRAWADEVKRVLVRDAFTKIWSNKGSEATLRHILTTFGLSYDIWMGDSLLAGVHSVPHIVGSPEWRYVIRVSLNYLRDSYEFKLAEKINRLYGPLFTDNRVAYKQFFAGFSVANDPTFTQEG